jgi:selenocysteine lyase/cysteine desulfurase
MEQLEGAEVLNDVVLNQVLVRFGGDDDVTSAVIDGVAGSGEAWLGGTVWHGLGAARVSFSNWSTTDEDVDRLVSALSAALAATRAQAPVR